MHTFTVNPMWMWKKQWRPFKYDVQAYKAIVLRDEKWMALAYYCPIKRVTYDFRLFQLELTFRLLTTSTRQIVFMRSVLTTRLNQVYLKLSNMTLVECKSLQIANHSACCCNVWSRKRLRLPDLKIEKPSADIQCRKSSSKIKWTIWSKFCDWSSVFGFWTYNLKY